MIKKDNTLKHVLILTVISYLFFMFGNSIVTLTDPDEVFYSLSAKEMVKQGTWLTPYLFGQPQFEKPIFLFWLLRVAYLLFGITSFAARFFPALFGMAGVVGAYFLAKIGFKSENKAFICALVLMSSGLYIGLSRTVFTDMIFSVFILFSLLSFYWGYMNREKKSVSIILFSCFSALAVLTKGVLGFFIPFLVVVSFLSARREMKYLLCRDVLWGGLLLAVMSLPWYMFMVKEYNGGFIHEFFYNDHIRRFIEAEHLGNDTWYFYPLSMIACMFPWSIFVAVALFLLIKNIRRLDQLHLFLACWIGVVFLVFQPAHSKLVSYIFPLFPALALAGGSLIYDTALFENKNRTFFILSLITWAILLLFPIGVIFAAKKYPDYVPNALPLYYFAGIFCVLLVSALLSIMKYKFRRTVYLFSVSIWLFFLVIPFTKGDFEPFVASKAASEYLLKNYDIKNTILTSKFNARGVRFYTDKEVAVVDISGKNFFSPHPVPYFSAAPELKEFLARQGVTYCVVKKSVLDEFDRLRSQGFDYSVLEKIGNVVIVRVEAKTG